ncbi:MAG: NADH:flavin oxidoreductase [Anaerolineae bacterium]|nr:NADH:flavin oxidoreductase [Anaerolineae bacterium]
MSYRRVAQLRTANDFRKHLAGLGVELVFDEKILSGSESPLAQSYTVHGKTIGNRFAVLPMEGWDGTADGHPNELVTRRWQRFGLSGAKLIWGGEAVAVRHDGRANPRQLVINEQTLGDLANLRKALVDSHQEHYGNTDDLMIGVQLTHSGRFCRPVDKRLQPQILYHHPLLDNKFHLPPDYPLMTDSEIDDLIGDFVRAAVQAQQAGFEFVDVKHCHGYLGHEFLSAIDRPGKYGGSFENRTRFLREVVEGIRRDAPGLHIGVRLSAFDWIPFRPGADGTGQPEQWTDGNYPYAFGGNHNGTEINLTEPHAFLDLLEKLDIRLVCITAGSPYYNPHIQRPALFPPSDGYQPPEDPLVGAARQIQVVAELKKAHPNLLMVGSGYSYLQDWLPYVAQAVVREGMADFVGIGRMVLSYPEMPADVLAGRPLQRKRICRTFSDCTTAPRNGLISGCYPLDDFYKDMPEAETLAGIKNEAKQAAAE